MLIYSVVLEEAQLMKALRRFKQRKHQGHYFVVEEIKHWKTSKPAFKVQVYKDIPA